MLAIQQRLRLRITLFQMWLTKLMKWTTLFFRLVKKFALPSTKKVSQPLSYSHIYRILPSVQNLLLPEDGRRPFVTANLCKSRYKWAARSRVFAFSLQRENTKEKDCDWCRWKATQTTAKTGAKIAYKEKNVRHIQFYVIVLPRVALLDLMPKCLVAF